MKKSSGTLPRRHGNTCGEGGSSICSLFDRLKLWYNARMKLIAQVKLLPTPEQANILRKTLETANTACNAISQQAWENKTFRQFPLHRLSYQAVREQYPLAAQVVVRCIAKVADAYKIDHQTKRTFKASGAIAFDSRILSYDLAGNSVSIWTIAGRQRIAFAAGERQLELLRGQRGESDLCLVEGSFYLLAVCDVETAAPMEVEDYLGVDLGVKNIATDSDANQYSGGQVNGLRKRYFRIRQRLQSKGTKSAKRLLKKRRQKERRFAKQENHRIAKELVLRAKDTGRGIALEDLQGIRDRVTVRKSQRRQHHAWGFFDLRSKIAYKAEWAGVPLVLVDPRNTSRTCPQCGYVDRANRKSQSLFSCGSCGFSGHADHIAAVNISRVAVNQPDVSWRSRAAGTMPRPLAAGSLQFTSRREP
jgi:putative transposase